MDDPDAANVYEREGKVVYRASALGGCLRSLALARQGYDAIPPPPSFLELFKGGHDAEDATLNPRTFITRRQERVELPISATISVVGHIDGMDDMGLVEVKSQSRDEWEKGSITDSFLWDKYAYQLSVYIHALEVPRARVYRVLRSDDNDNHSLKIETFDEAPHTLGAIRQRVFEVEVMARRELSDVQCSAVMFPCPYFYTHKSDEVREFVDDHSALLLAQQATEASLARQVAEEKYRVSKEALLTWLGERDKVELPDGWKLTKFKTKGGRREFDVKPSVGLRIIPPKKEPNAAE